MSGNLFTGDEISLESIEGKLFECTPIVQSTRAASTKKRFLAVNDSFIIELSPHPFKRKFASVLEVHSLEKLSKLKFQKGVSIHLYLKNDRIISYNMNGSSDCVEYIRSRMASLGRNSKKSSVITTRNIIRAEGIFERMRSIEESFSTNPTHERVEQLMDLLREAAEKFGEANDARYMEAVAITQKFLERDDVTRVLSSKSGKIVKERELKNSSNLSKPTNHAKQMNLQINDSYVTLSPIVKYESIENEYISVLSHAVQLTEEQDMTLESSADDHAILEISGVSASDGNGDHGCALLQNRIGVQDSDDKPGDQVATSNQGHDDNQTLLDEDDLESYFYQIAGELSETFDSVASTDPGDREMYSSSTTDRPSQTLGSNGCKGSLSSTDKTSIGEISISNGENVQYAFLDFGDELNADSL